LNQLHIGTDDCFCFCFVCFVLFNTIWYSHGATSSMDIILASTMLASTLDCLYNKTQQQPTKTTKQAITKQATNKQRTNNLCHTRK